MLFGLSHPRTRADESARRPPSKWAQGRPEPVSGHRCFGKLATLTETQPRILLWLEECPALAEERGGLIPFDRFPRRTGQLRSLHRRHTRVCTASMVDAHDGAVGR